MTRLKHCQRDGCSRQLKRARSELSWQPRQCHALSWPSAVPPDPMDPLGRVWGFSFSLAEFSCLLSAAAASAQYLNLHAIAEERAPQLPAGSEDGPSGPNESASILFVHLIAR